MSQSTKSLKAERVVYDELKGAGCEETQGYNIGGFHPVHLGDVLNDRFEVSHKLGNGGFGTVWLCWDQKYNTWKAVKVMAADHSVESNESKIFRHLLQGSSVEELEQNYVAVPQEEFWVQGPNGRHVCYVLPLYGSTVADWTLFCFEFKNDNSRKEMKDICRQVSSGMQYLHSRGVCHGDFRPGNILMKLKNLDHLGREEILELMGEPETIEVEARGGADPRAHGPEYCVIPVNQDKNWCFELMIPEIVIVDFGESFFFEQPPKRLGTPLDYAAPEVMFINTFPLGPKADIWALATTLFSIWHGPIFGEDSLSKVVPYLEIYAGPLPKEYRVAYRSVYAATERDGGFDDDFSKPFRWNLEEFEACRRSLPELTGYMTHLQDTLAREVNVLKGRAQHLPTIEELKTSPTYGAERYHILMFADLLEQILQYDPRRRPDIKSVVRHPFFKDTVQIPVVYKLRQYKYYKLAQHKLQGVFQIKSQLSNRVVLNLLTIATWVGLVAIMMVLASRTQYSICEHGSGLSLNNGLAEGSGICKCVFKNPR